MKYILSQDELDDLRQSNDRKAAIAHKSERDELIEMILKADTAQIVEDPMTMDKKILLGIDPRSMPPVLQERLERRLLMGT